MFLITCTILGGLEWNGLKVMNGMFVLDAFAGFAKIIILLGLSAAVMLSVTYLYQERIARFEYPVLILFAGLGMMIMVSADNFLAMYLGLELQSLSLYVLAAIRRDHAKSAEAGIKYFVLGALASGLLLFGISLVYGYTGALSFGSVQASIISAAAISPALIVGMVFVLTGIAFKVSAVPFHMWTPDVYEGAPTSVTALFAIVPKVAAIALLLRLLAVPFGPAADDWQQVIWALAAASMIVGAFAALRQENIKRLMAYSSISNMGYAMVGVAAGGAQGMNAVMSYLVIYMVMTAGVFGIILMMRRGEIATDKISDLSGLSRNHPLMAYALAILMFSMAGIPPMAGFFGKLFIFNAAVAEGLYVLAVIGVLSSVVAAYYYLRIIKVMFFDEAVEAFDKDSRLRPARLLVFACIIFVTCFILAPDMLLEQSHQAVAALLP